MEVDGYLAQKACAYVRGIMHIKHLQLLIVNQHEK